jgi:hypothetical protein
MYVNFKSVNDRRAKGIILTAESLYQLRRTVDNLKDEPTKFGAKVIVDFLEQCYEKIE